MIFQAYVLEKRPLKEVKSIVETSDDYFRATYGSHLSICYALHNA